MISRAQVKKAVIQKREELGLKKGENKILISKLGLGENNLNFLVTAGKKKFVFRACYQEHGKAHLRQEFEMLKNIPKGIGPIPIMLDDAKKIIPMPYSILSYIEGKVKYKWEKADIVPYANALAKLHSIKSDFAGRPGAWKKHIAITEFLKKEANGYFDGSSWLRKDCDVKRFYPALKRYIKEKNHLFLSMKRFSLIHNDPCVMNSLFHKGKVMFIDWEWMMYGDPAKDISHLFDPEVTITPWSVNLNPEKIELLLKTYLKYNPDKTLRERLKVWHEMNLFSSLLFFKWKLANFHKGHKLNSLSKKKYKEGLKITLEELDKRFPRKNK